MNKCNCWIGILNSHSQSDSNNLYESDYYVKTRETYQLISYEYSVFGRDISPVSSSLDILDRRKNYATLFNFCPMCGKKLNWKKLRKNIKSVLVD